MLCMHGRLVSEWSPTTGAEQSLCSHIFHITELT